MNYGILFDIAIVILFVIGYMKGYRRGIITMAVPLVSFIVGLVGLKLFGAVVYAIFGDAIETLFRNFLLAKIADTEIINVIFAQMINDALIKKIVQIVCFMITYVITSAITAYLLRKMKLSINNTFINSLDKNFGGAVGVISSAITVMLILAIFSILITANEESVLNTLVSTGYIGKFLYMINPLRLLLG